MAQHTSDADRQRRPGHPRAGLGRGRGGGAVRRPGPGCAAGRPTRRRRPSWSPRRSRRPWPTSRPTLDQKQYGPAVRAAIKLLAARGPAARGSAASRSRCSRATGSSASGSSWPPGRPTRTPRRDPRPARAGPGHVDAGAAPPVQGHRLRAARGRGGRGGRGPLDLLTPDGRRAAFAALLDDQLSLLSPQVKLASSSPSLPQILPVVQQVQSLAELDEIANGSDARTAATAGTLLDHARTLMATALKGMWTRVERHPHRRRPAGDRRRRHGARSTASRSSRRSPGRTA